MSVSFGLGVNLGTSQKLTPQMQQAIRLLQLSSLELEQEVQMKLDSNPMLERETDDFDTTSKELGLDDWAGDHFDKVRDSSQDDGFGDEPAIEDSFDKLGNARLDDDAFDSDWESVYGDYDKNDWGGAQGDDNDYLGETKDSIQDHIRWQMNFRQLSEIDKVIFEHLIDSMDDLGYIRTSVNDIVANFATVMSFYQADDLLTVTDVERVLSYIQACEPTGVGARNLAECLSLQLDELPFDTEGLGEARLTLTCLHHLESNNIKALTQETGLSTEEVKEALELIRMLDPNPALTFMSEQGLRQDNEARDIPDVLVIAKDHHKRSTIHANDTESWRVLLNPETLPRLKVNQEYASLIRRGDDSADNTYLKTNLSDAKLFIRSIEERNQNLLKVATCIVQKQQAFLLGGAKMMQPLTLKDVADSVGLHESTVSRLTTNKSMLTPQGMFTLKYFFSSHVTSTEGEVSSTAISAMIETMIKEENPEKPLSDNAITKRLEAQGIDIARRTVTKYREAMNIGSSTERKVRF